MEPIIIPLRLSHVYVLPCNEGYLQIDTGYERDYPKYRKNLSKAGISISSIKYLVLTHHHDDHAGFLNDMTNDSNCVVIAHELSRDLLKGGKNDTSHGGGYVNRFVKFVTDIKMRIDTKWTLSFPSFELRDNDLLVSGDDNVLLRNLGIDGKIVYTPGHCIDHLAIVLDNGAAFCGDAAASFILWAGTKYCTVFMTDMEQAYRSWQKMIDAGADTIYPAHGNPFSADKLTQNIGKIKTADLARFF